MNAINEPVHAMRIAVSGTHRSGKSTLIEIGRELSQQAHTMVTSAFSGGSMSADIIDSAPKESRLTQCADWVEFDGLSATQKILGGFGNLEDNRLFFPEGEVRAVALRSFDPKSLTWSIWWLDGRNPGELDKPVVGRFSDGRGEFYTDDELNGKPIRIRFVWLAGDGTRPTWEQAFSPDGGSSWETNWTMEFTRTE
jgi:hypothetical protein